MREKQTWDYTAKYEAQPLDEKGRCCGRKPIVYKRPQFHTFCCRCDRSHNQNGEQIENWGWRKMPDGMFMRKDPLQTDLYIPKESTCAPS